MSHSQPLRRFRFSLRSLFVLVTLACCGFGWLGYKLKQARDQRDAVQAIFGLRGDVWYAGGGKANLANPPTAPGAPAWLRNLLGDDFFAIVTGASFFDSRLIDDDLAFLHKLPRLELLELSTTQVSDAGLLHIAGLTRIRTLALSRTNIGDAGLVHLQRLTQLESLYLHGTQISDEGLIHLTGFKKLEKLWLSDTLVSDAGLDHLERLPRLKEIWLGGTAVTDAGAARFQQALPSVTIHRHASSNL